MGTIDLGSILIVLLDFWTIDSLIMFFSSTPIVATHNSIAILLAVASKRHSAFVVAHTNDQCVYLTNFI